MESPREIKPLDLAELESVSGGGGYDRIHDLSLFERRTVCNVVHYDSSAHLTMRRSPGGEVIPGIGWTNGESIMIHSSYSVDGWLFAFESGQFGYVSSNYVY